MGGGRGGVKEKGVYSLWEHNNTDEEMERRETWNI